MIPSKLPATSSSFALGRLIEQYQKHNQLVIAYDFDDTVKPYWCGDCTEIQSLLRGAKRTLNAYFIVYTSNKDIEGIKAFLNEENIPYDSINENAPFAPPMGGKIYYNLFLDDKAGLQQAAGILHDLIYLVDNGEIRKEMSNV
jgi:hypothetical protein